MLRSILRTAVFAAALSLLVTASFARQPQDLDPADLAGKYELSGGGYLVVSVDDLGRVEGFYERNGQFGRLSGELEWGLVFASWVQKGGSQACETSSSGSSHWGRVKLAPAEDGGLDLAWGECGGGPLQLETAR